MLGILEDRPFTRRRQQRVRVQFDVWKCRSLLRMLRKPQSLDMIMIMGMEIAETLSRNTEALHIIGPELCAFSFIRV